MLVPGFKKPALGTRDKSPGSIQSVKLDQGLCDQPGIPKCQHPLWVKERWEYLPKQVWAWGRSRGGSLPQISKPLKFGERNQKNPYFKWFQFISISKHKKVQFFSGRTHFKSGLEGVPWIKTWAHSSYKNRKETRSHTQWEQNPELASGRTTLAMTTDVMFRYRIHIKCLLYA